MPRNEKFEFQVPFAVAMGLVVATAAAEEILENLRWDHPFGSVRTPKPEDRPILNTIVFPASSDRLRVRFLGGVNIKVWLSDLNIGSRRQRWAVSQLETSYFVCIANQEDRHVEEVWGLNRLFELQTRRPWKEPELFSVEYINDAQKRSLFSSFVVCLDEDDEIAELLPLRMGTALRNAGIVCIGDLVQKSIPALAALLNLSPTALVLTTLQKVLARRGLRLGQVLSQDLLVKLEAAKRGIPPR